VVAGELPPPQPASKERVRVDPTRKRIPGRTSSPEKQKSFRRTISGDKEPEFLAALFYRKRFDSIGKLLRCLVKFKDRPTLSIEFWTGARSKYASRQHASKNIADSKKCRLLV
jgi:hypothetical protein